MEIIFLLTIFFVFFLGAIFGSFLNVVVAEIEPNVFLEKEERKKKNLKSFWKRINRRSACPKCKNKLSVLELIPIFSWLGLWGKCYSCKTKISSRYFWVELFSGITFLFAFWHLLNKFSVNFIQSEVILNQLFWIEFVFLIPLICSIILIFIFDLKHKIIPDLVIIPAILYGLIFISFDFNSINFNFENWFSDIWRAISFAMPFFAIWFVSRGRAMGFADWKLVFFLSLFLNNPLENLLFIFGAFWVGALYSIPALILGKSKLKSQIPFGPFIIISFLLVWSSGVDFLEFTNFFRW